MNARQRLMAEACSEVKAFPDKSLLHSSQLAAGTKNQRSRTISGKPSIFANLETLL
jgi:hypothetical protein